MVNVFGVDALYPAADDAALQRFIAGFTHLPWPSFYREFYIGPAGQRVATFLDIYHPVRHLFEEFVKDREPPRVRTTLYEWEPTDALADVMLTTFGSYPAAEEIGKDYADFVVRNLAGQRIRIDAAGAMPEQAYTALTPSAVTVHRLDGDQIPTHRGGLGVYVGDAGLFADLVNFWNLRAANMDLIFYDPNHDARIRALKDSWIAKLNERPEDPIGFRNQVAVWRAEARPFEPGRFGRGVINYTVSDDTWNGFNVRPARMHIDGEQPVLASVSGGTSAHFQLPSKPFYAEPEFHNQKAVISVRSIGGVSEISEVSFTYPFIPELNQYYGTHAYFIARNDTRSEQNGLGIITAVTRFDLQLHALPPSDLISRMFEVFGMKAEPSQPGRIATRLIQQVGGLQGCRVFKIRGVRNLIERYGPLQSFTRSDAIQTIGQNDPVTHQPRFEEYENLYIEYREGGKLKPEHAFTFLLKKGVFRVGINLQCPACELMGWLRLVP